MSANSTNRIGVVVVREPVGQLVLLLEQALAGHYR